MNKVYITSKEFDPEENKKAGKKLLLLEKIHDELYEKIKESSWTVTVIS